MNPIASHLIDGLLVLEEAVGATLVFAAETYPCVGGAEIGGKMLGAGGFRTTAQCPIVLRVGALGGATEPKEKEKLTYSSAAGVAARALRIDGVTRVYGEILVLECNDPKQAA